MYGTARQTGLGVMASCDMFGNDGLQPGDAGYDASLVYDDSTGCWYREGDGSSGGGVDIALTPAVVETTRYPAPAPVLIQPVSFMTPQQLPPIVANVPAPSTSPIVPVLVIGVLLFLVTRNGRN